MEKIEITNPDLFLSKKVEVYTSQLNVGFVQDRFVATGTIRIVYDKDTIISSGEHGQYDYEEDFGFILQANEH